jgi:hypothetical protein
MVSRRGAEVAEEAGSQFSNAGSPSKADRPVVTSAGVQTLSLPGNHKPRLALMSRQTSEFLGGVVPRSRLRSP